jgi:hypothetical protein
MQLERFSKLRVASTKVNPASTIAQKLPFEVSRENRFGRSTRRPGDNAGWPKEVCEKLDLRGSPDLGMDWGEKKAKKYEEKVGHIWAVGKSGLGLPHAVPEPIL